MKTVLVSQRVDWDAGRKERRDSLDQRLVGFLAEGGYSPIPVPNSLPVEGVYGDILSQWMSALRPSAIVLSGGNDIGDDPMRDRTELALLSFALSVSLPVLGICRGMQMMGVQAGSKLRKSEGHVRTRHDLTGEINREVNSFHGMALESCPIGYEVIAQCADGGIEAIRHRRLGWEGWMWHPEREDPFFAEDLSRLGKVLR